jgi:acyl-CoA reductase-like NAD-dependent aldehyde dehydrogenase
LTLEFGRRLEYDHRYQKLALDAELKRMEEMAKSKNLDELQAVGPILSQIAADTSVINMVRARAQRLLAMGGGSARGN